MDPSQIIDLLIGAGTAVMVFYVIVLVLMIVSMWIIFSKAGKPGWAAIIPIYNIIVFVQVAQKGWGWTLVFLLSWLLMFIPVLGWIIYPILMLVAVIIVYHGISKSFGQGGGYTVGLVLLPVVFFPILAFGKATWTAKA